MDIAHLRIIHALHQYQTLGAAAEALCLTQSALSHRMKALEHEIGIAFWNKQGQRLSLTPAGQELLRLAQRVLPEIEVTRSRLKLMADGRGGRLHIAVECLPCAQWLNPALAAFMRDWAEIDVDVVSQYRFSAQMHATGQLATLPADPAALLAKVYCTPLYRLAAETLSLPYPTVDYLPSVHCLAPWMLRDASQPIAMGNSYVALERLRLG